MLDSYTHKPIRVLGDKTTRGVIDVRVDQLDTVRGLLEAKGIPHWVKSQFISFDNEPALAFIVLGHDVDPQTVQAILDHVA